MGRIKINIDNVASASASVRSAGNRLQSARYSFNSTCGSLDWRIKQRYGIEDRISAISQTVSEAEDILRRLSAVMDKAAESYTFTELRLVRLTGNVRIKLNNF